MNLTPYNSLDDIARSKAEILEKRREKSEEIKSIWNDTIKIPPQSTKGELIATAISKGVLAFDVFLMIRKLSKRKKSFFSFFKKKKK